MDNNLKFGEMTGAIIGCAMKVHTYFGSGFKEAIYQRSLLMELKEAGLACLSETSKDVFYKGKVVGRKRLDLIVENKILIEIKAIPELTNGCFHQVINYLTVFDLEVGLLLNFGRESLQYKRFVRSKSSVKSKPHP